MNKKRRIKPRADVTRGQEVQPVQHFGYTDGNGEYPGMAP